MSGPDSRNATRWPRALEVDTCSHQQVVSAVTATSFIWFRSYLSWGLAGPCELRQSEDGSEPQQALSWRSTVLRKLLKYFGNLSHVLAIPGRHLRPRGWSALAKEP